ncbi:MAG: hypothetical protein ACRDJE_10285 [Dehalococcoidia bacterium]
MLRDAAGPTAVVVIAADALLKADVHAFVRSVHLLSDVVADVERAASDGFQFEIFFVGDFELDTDGSCRTRGDGSLGPSSPRCGRCSQSLPARLLPRSDPRLRRRGDAAFRRQRGFRQHRQRPGC